MAIFYNHIKGCGKNTTGTTDSLSSATSKTTVGEAWTWIKWADELTYTKNSSADSADLAYVENNPYIYLNHANLTNNTLVDSPLSLGRIITSRSKGQSIDTSFEFRQNLSVRNIDIQGRSQSTGVDNPSQFGSVGQSQFQFLNKSQLRFYLSDFSSAFGTISYSNDGESDTKYNYLDIDSNEGTGIIMLTSKGVVLRTGGLYVRDTNSYGQTEVERGVIKADKKCEALYFNAISDRRAKSNITPAEFSALDIIKQLPIYTFNYLNDPQLSVGLIAQEAAEHDLDGFNMVDNLDAPGEFGDFMQMKESKLVYVLWKAVQELSAEVETLKAEIHNLK